MELLSEYSHTIELGMRFLVATALGAVVGFDRELKHRPAGLRTHMLVALAACVFTVLTLELYEQYAGRAEPPAADPIRIIEAVTAGVAFLAAGAIIQARGQIQGLTTGAGMWLAGAVGIACGLGRFELGVIAVVLAAIVMVILRPVEKFLQRRDKNE